VATAVIVSTLLTADSSAFLPWQSSNCAREEGVLALVLEDQAGKNWGLLREEVAQGEKKEQEDRLK